MARGVGRCLRGSFEVGEAVFGERWRSVASEPPCSKLEWGIAVVGYMRSSAVGACGLVAAAEETCMVSPAAIVACPHIWHRLQWGTLLLLPRCSSHWIIQEFSVVMVLARLIVEWSSSTIYNSKP